MLEKKKESIQEKEAVLKSGYPAGKSGYPSGKSTSTREEASGYKCTRKTDRFLGSTIYLPLAEFPLLETWIKKPYCLDLDYCLLKRTVSVSPSFLLESIVCLLGFEVK